MGGSAIGIRSSRRRWLFGVNKLALFSLGLFLLDGVVRPFRSRTSLHSKGGRHRDMSGSD